MSAQAAPGLVSQDVELTDDSAEHAFLARRGCRFGVLAAVCWIALGVDSIVRPYQVNLRDGLLLIPWVFTAITFWYVHLVQRSAAGRVERTGHVLVQIASVLVFFGNVGLVTDQPVLAIFTVPWGALLWAAALVVFGIGTRKAAVLPGYAGVALMLLEPCSMLSGLALSPISPIHDRGAYSGALVKGFLVALVSAALMRAGKFRAEVSRST